MRWIGQPNDDIFGGFVGVALGLRRIRAALIGRQDEARAGEGGNESGGG